MRLPEKLFRRRPSKVTLRVLHALLENSRGWRHGYPLGQELGIKPGTLYPILIRLEERGVLEARWEEGQTKARHSYRLTAVGKEYAAQCLRDSIAERAIAGLPPLEFD